ncbi:MAG: FadR/GntR family transcriptional regulator [Desulfosarcinaceae bacterium]
MPSGFNKIKKNGNLYEDVVKEIRRAILSGTFQTGTVLPSEITLAEQFGVSRPVVREALRCLQSSGFIEIRRGTKGGAFVRDIIQLPFIDDFADLILYRRIKVDHLAQARLMVEPEVCRMAALNAAPENLREMRELVESYTDIAESAKKDVLFSHFHRLVGRACGNPLYAILIESIMDFTDGFIKIIRPVSNVIHDDRDHDLILAALEHRQPDKAAEVATRHAAQILESMRRLEKTYLELLRGNTVDAVAAASL